MQPVRPVGIRRVADSVAREASRAHGVSLGDSGAACAGRPARWQARHSRAPRNGRKRRNTRRAALAAVDVSGAAIPKRGERPRLGRAAGADAERAREPPKQRPVAGARPLQPPRPGVRGLVEERVALLGLGQVRRDRDAVGRAVLDVAARQLAARDADAGRIEAEARGEPVVEPLQAQLGVGLRRSRRAGSTEIRLAHWRSMVRNHALEESPASRRRRLDPGALAAQRGNHGVVPERIGDHVRATSPCPTARGKKPAIVVIHEWWGLNDFVKGRADAFAKQGYVALAVDLYRGKVAERRRYRAPADARHAGGPRRARPEGGRRVSALAPRRRRREDRRRSAGAWAAGYRSSSPRARRAHARRRRSSTTATSSRSPTTIAGPEGPAARQLRRDRTRAFRPRTSRPSRRRRGRRATASTSRSIPTRATRSRRRRTRRSIRPDDAKDADARTDAFLCEGAEGEVRPRQAERGRGHAPPATRARPLRLAVLVPVRVDLLEVLPLLGDRLLGEDRRHRAGRLAVAALDADVRIDVEQRRPPRSPSRPYAGGCSRPDTRPRRRCPWCRCTAPR